MFTMLFFTKTFLICSARYLKRVFRELIQASKEAELLAEKKKILNSCHINISRLVYHEFHTLVAL